MVTTKAEAGPTSVTNKEKDKAREVQRIKKESKAEETKQLLLVLFLDLLKMRLWREERESLLVGKREEGFGVEVRERGGSFGILFGERENGD